MVQPVATRLMDWRDEGPGVHHSTPYLFCGYDGRPAS